MLREELGVAYYKLFGNSVVLRDVPITPIPPIELENVFGL